MTRDAISGRKIIVFCPHFDENSGGAIVLHALIHRLNEAGAVARAYPFKWANLKKSLPSSASGWSRSFHTMALNWRAFRKARHVVKQHPSMPIPIARVSDLDNGVVVYPEIIKGNPLGAKRVVRWMLNSEGFFGEGGSFDSDELVFHYQEAFTQNGQTATPDHILRVRWLRDDIYRNEDRPDRAGACRMIRKGAPLDPDAPFGDPEAEILDGKSHAQVADAFNRTKYFYCHDPYTMYAYYAALCGCIPIVQPQKDLSAADWRAAFELKQGVAYGEAEADWAVQTRPDLLTYMQQARASELDNVRSFVKVVNTHFGT